MRPFVHVLAVAALLALVAVASAQTTGGEVKMAAGEVAVRLKPEPGAQVVRVLQQGVRVRVEPAKPSGWLAVYDLSEPKRDPNRAIGYAEATSFAVPGTPHPENPATALSSGTKGKSSQGVKPGSELKASAVQSPPVKAAKDANQDPVRITSDKMVYSQTDNAVVFQGNVHGAQADMAIWASKITAYFADKAKTPGSQQKENGTDLGAGKIDRIVAEGDVRLVAGKNEGACAQLTYFVNEGVLRMEGNPILREGQNTVRGDVIKYYLNEKRSEVLSGAQRRVEAVFFTPGSDRK
ncbi:LptA/OstA family protein [Humidesulfovibrio mexicanus]|nr:LptA/OstA family protein [Humidesulfovibrio mexicanus]